MKKVILAAALAGGALWACHEAGRPGLVEGAGSEEIFIKRVMGDTATLSQDLTWDAARAGVDYVESPDGSIRVYRWISGGGTCAFWTTVTQYRDTKGRVRCFYGLPLFGNDSLLTVTDILMADRPGKPPVYLFCFYCKASSTEGYNDLYPAVLQTDTFALGPKFERDGETTESVGIGYDMPDWYFRANDGEGWEWMCAYLPDRNWLYVPVADEDMRLTGRHDVYAFDGRCFRYIGVRAPYYLHASLHDFAFMEKVLETDRHLVRVDRMRDGTFRMALWNAPDTARQSDEPVWVVGGGFFDSLAGKYVFPVAKDLQYECRDLSFSGLRMTYRGKTVFAEDSREMFNRYKKELEGSFPQMDGMLQDYAAPLLVHLTERHVLRVDSMTDGCFRLAAWTRAGAVDGMRPERVLRSRYKTEGCYVFNGGGFQYVVPISGTDYFCVYKGNTLLSGERIVQTYFPEEIERLGKNERKG